jgi:hypothetical protein
LQQYHTAYGDIQVTGRASVTLAYLSEHLVHQLAGILRAALAEAHAGQGLQGVHAVGAYRESRLHLRFTLRLGVLFVTAPGFSQKTENNEQKTTKMAEKMSTTCTKIRSAANKK